MTQQSDTRSKIRAIISQQLNIELGKLDDTQFLTEQGADEFDMIEITMKLEDQFSLIISDEDIQKLTTVDDTISYIAARKIQKTDTSITH